jgi:hypothetical protein
MGIEQAAFLVFMTQQGPLNAENPRPYASAGHYTKDDTQNLLFVGSLFQIMADRSAIYLRPTQFKLCMKIGYSFINLYQQASTVADILQKLYSMSPQLKSQDQAVGIFISNFVKP